VYRHLVVGRVLVYQAGFDQSGNGLWRIWGHEYFLDDKWHHSSVTGVLLQVLGEHRFIIVGDSTSDQVQSRGWWKSLLSFPLDWLWWLFIFLRCCFLCRRFLFITFRILLILRHQLAEHHSDRVVLLQKGVRISLNLWHARDHRQIDV
jgi:hypothetical protein